MIRGSRVTSDGTVLDPAGIDIATHERGQSSPSCVAVGDVYWVSYHTNACDSTYSNIYISRVNASGLGLDPDGLPICTAEGEQRKPEILSGDNSLLVAWVDDRDYDSTAYDVYGSRISLDGTVLDPGGMLIADSDLLEEAPALCWTDQTFLAAWQVSYYGTEGEVLGVWIDTLGLITDSVPTVISAACHAQITAASGWSGNSYLALWEEGGDLHGRRFDHMGNAVDPVIIDVCSAEESQAAPDLAWGEETFLALWEDSRSGDFDIYGTRIDSVGTILDPFSLPLKVDPTTDQRRPSIAFDGANFLAVWQDMLEPTGSYCRIEGLRLSQAGDPIDPEAFAISSGEKSCSPEVAFGGGKYLVVWKDGQFYDIYGALVDTVGTIKSQFGIRTTSGLQENPVVASDGSDFLVVWEDFGSHWPNSDIVATRVTSSGVVLDPGGITISDAPDPELVPSVTFDGANYVIVWKRSSDLSGELYAGRVTSQGQILDPGGIFLSAVSSYSGISISSGPQSTGFAEVGGQSLFLYSRYQSHPYNSLRMFGAFFWGEPEPNYPPEPFSLLLPADQDTVSEPVSLDWEDAFDPNPSDLLSYTVYLSFSEQFPPGSTQVIGGLSSSDCQAWLETDSLVYWWRVKAQDRWGETSWSNQIFSFDLQSYGDANGDGAIDLGDAVFLINYLFKEGESPEPLAAGDTNGDCEVNIGDVVYLLNYLFKSGPRPVAGCA